MTFLKFGSYLIQEHVKILGILSEKFSPQTLIFSDEAYFESRAYVSKKKII